MTSTAIKFDITARVLHWVSALVILWATISGFIITTLNIDETIKHQIASLNVSVTTIFIPLFLFRVIYRLIRGVPANADTLTESEASIARAMHILLYVLVSVVLVSGVLMMKQDFSLFNTFKLNHLIIDKNELRFFREMHTFSTIALAACIALHLVALLKHEISGKRILNRMI